MAPPGPTASLPSSLRADPTSVKKVEARRRHGGAVSEQRHRCREERGVRAEGLGSFLSSASRIRIRSVYLYPDLFIIRCFLAPFVFMLFVAVR